ncbi:Plasmodium exported protein, unknown function [Plasmodium relictum]|uniref:Fam-h protein n=1 Tax=Plasmodium relictum TaxID=85471 RepID=A0A1J1GKG9_PLARL|nr:Plasmodium exported protein, unknown function [Plasmodium relictum]CRG85125.1 Plasmodium exported protein, unknown function [Plasmodium relictum]
MHSNREKKNILKFLIKLFTFVLLILILPCSNDWNFIKSLSYKNDLKKTLNLGIKRFLAQKDIIKETSKKPKLCDMGITKTNLEQRNDPNKIEKKMDIEQGNEIEAKDENKKVKFNQRILEKCKNNLKLVSSSFAVFLSIFSFIYNAIAMNVSIILPNLDMVFVSISLLIISIILIQERIEIKYKNKF